ncbi:hypothetical protein CEXT_153371 [Caerostris extrusa]|uniref:Uncharacterized protein n=1 Tax=Caerostris extrusa TaxID=172846 RepID=A0AAV4UXU7_CAEEX|nr:hypothetical protein CEXT_153371 [Caerostris extrusa]
MKAPFLPHSMKVLQHEEKQSFTQKSIPTTTTIPRYADQYQISKPLENNHVKHANPSSSIQRSQYRNVNPYYPNLKHINEKYVQGSRSRLPFHNIPQRTTTPHSNQEQSPVAEALHARKPLVLNENYKNGKSLQDRSRLPYHNIPQRTTISHSNHEQSPVTEALHARKPYS